MKILLTCLAATACFCLSSCTTVEPSPPTVSTSTTTTERSVYQRPATPTVTTETQTLRSL